MRNRLLTAVALLGTASLAALSTSASAGVNVISSSSALNAAGTITESFDFSAFPGGFTYPSNPYTVGSVTFTTGENIIVGTTSGYGLPENTLAYNQWSPLTGTIAGTYNLFGFRLGTAGTASPLTGVFTTNLGSYTFSLNTALSGATALAFNGFQATGGEYFTGFNLSSAAGAGSAPAITGIQLGTAGTSAVPEPATWVMMLAGFGMVGAALRRRQQAAVRFAF